MTVAGLHQLVMFIRVPKNGETLEEVLRALHEHKVLQQSITSIPFTDGENSQVLLFFTCSKDVQVEISETLAGKGIGQYGSGTDVSVLPLALSKDMRKIDTQAKAAADAEHHEHKKDGTKPLTVFQSTIKARIAVENVRVAKGFALRGVYSRD